MIKACIFDLDGTLINSIEDLAVAMNQALLKVNKPVHPTDAYFQFVGNGTDMLVKRALLFDEEYEAQVKEDFLDYYGKHDDVYTVPYDGINELLNELITQGIKLAIVTNKDQSRMVDIVSKIFPDVPFEIMCGDDKTTIKPDPTKTLHTLSVLGVNQGECLFIGDSDVDMQTGNNAGLGVVGVLWGFRSEEELKKAGADFIISHPIDLLNCIKSLN